MTFQFDTGYNPRPAAVLAHPANGFAKHGIDHLSASSVNLWVNAPDMWVAKYLHGFKGSFGAAPLRGQCVEDGVVLALQGKSVADALAAAHARFDKQFPKPDEDAAKERDLIAPMMETALAELRGYGEPEFQDGQQEKISINADFGDWSIPVIGFLDLVFPSLGLVIDLKTTTRIPSVMSPDHQMQRAIYAKAKGNCAVKFLYVSAKKTALLEDGDVAQTLASLKAHIARLARFLAHCDRDTALQVVPHNPGSFYWRGDEQARFTLFGT